MSGSLLQRSFSEQTKEASRKVGVANRGAQCICDAEPVCAASTPFSTRTLNLEIAIKFHMSGSSH